MRIHVRTVGPIRRILGAKEFDVALEAEATVESLLRQLIQQHGQALASLVTDNEGRIAAQHIRVLVNGQDLFVLNDMNTTLHDGDVVSMVSVVAGGV